MGEDQSFQGRDGKTSGLYRTLSPAWDGMRSGVERICGRGRLVATPGLGSLVMVMAALSEWTTSEKHLRSASFLRCEVVPPARSGGDDRA